MDAVEMKFRRAPHGLEILRQVAGFENRTGPGGFMKEDRNSAADCLKVLNISKPGGDRRQATTNQATSEDHTCDNRRPSCPPSREHLVTCKVVGLTVN